MSTEICKQCGALIRGQEGGGICYECLASQTLKFLDDSALLSPSATSDELSVLSRFGDYELLREIARGGMGVVYRARKKGKNEVVALKLIHSGPVCSLRTEARFMTEIESAALLAHDHIVPILDVGTHDEMPFYTMRLIEGGSLADLEKQRYGIEGLRDSVARLIKVAEAVHYAHEHGIIHRDLKPSNVLLDEAGEPYVSDFGIAKRLDDQSDLTLTGEVLGTPSYMAPEQTMGSRVQQTIAVDVYSLGAILYHAITGKAPFVAGSPFETMKQIESQDAIRPSEFQSAIDHDLETIVLKCLEKDLSQRYPSAQALAEDLKRWIAGRPVEARPTPWWERIRKWCRRQPYLAFAAGVTLFLLGLLGLQSWAGVQRSQQEQRRIKNLSQRLGENLTSGRLRLADEYLQTGRRGEAVAHVAAIVRDRTGESAPLAYLKSLVEAEPFATQVVRPLAHSNTVWQVDFHPDGDRLVTASSDGKGRIWSFKSPNAPLYEFAHEAEVYRVDFNTSGNLVVTGSYDHTARIWDVETGQPISPELRLPGQVQIARFIGENDRFVVVSGGPAVRVWDTQNLERPHAELKVPPSQALIHIASTVPGDGNRLLVGSVVGGMWLWDWKRGEIEAERHSGAEYISDCVVSPAGDRFIPLGDVDTLALWSMDSFAPIARLNDAEPPRAIGFSSEMETFVTATRNGYQFWDTETGHPLVDKMVLSSMPALWKKINRLPCSERFELWYPFTYRSVFFFQTNGRPSTTPAISFSQSVKGVTPDPHRRRIAIHTADNRLHIWDYSRTLNRNVVYQTPGDFVGNRARFVRGNSGEPLLFVGAHGRTELKAVEFVDGGGSHVSIDINRDHRLREFFGPRSTGLLLARDLDRTSRALRFHPESKSFEQLTDGSKGKLWVISDDDQWGVGSSWGSDLPSLVPLSDPENALPLKNSEGMNLIIFSRDSRYVIGGAETGRVGVWDVDSCELVREVTIAARPVKMLDCSSDASLVTVGYEGGTLVSWRYSLEQGVVWERVVEDGIRAVVYSPDDRWVAIGTEGGQVLTFEAANGKVLPNPVRRQASIEVLQFTPDSRRLLIGSSDRTLGFWDPVSGFPISESVSFTGERRSVDLSPGGEWFCYGADEDTIEVRRVPRSISMSDVPAWLVPFCEAIAGLRLGANDALEVLPWEARMDTLDVVRAWVPGDPLVEWAHSLMSHRGR